MPVQPGAEDRASRGTANAAATASAAVVAKAHLHPTVRAKAGTAMPARRVPSGAVACFTPKAKPCRDAGIVCATKIVVAG